MPLSEKMPGIARLYRPVRRRLPVLNLHEHEEKILILLALVVSALVGLVVVAFLSLTDWMGRVLVSAGPVQRLVSPILGSLIAGYLLFRFFPDSRGSGIPQTRVALLLRSGVIGLRTVVGKFICSSISLASGIALGREGPSVQIGAGIASFAGRRLGLSPEHVRTLVPVGTAAAIAAAFNTPLAAVLFTLEEILADLHARVVGSVVIGAATSWIVLHLLLGDEPLFHVPAYQLVHPVEFLIYALLGVLGGVVSTAFVKFLLWQRTWFLRTPRRFQALTPGVGGLVVGLLALSTPGVLGVGYGLVADALKGQMAPRVMLMLMALKLIATVTSYSSGNAGGIFGPSLFIGAMLGGTVGHFAHAWFPDHTGAAGAYALVGMGAAFAGIIRTPMTSVIMIFELTRDYTIIVPLMIANLCSYFLAQKLQHMPVYEALARQDGVILPSSHTREPLMIESATLDPAPPGAGIDFLGHATVYPDDLIDSALQIMATEGRKEILVVSRLGGQPLGILTEADALEAYRNVQGQNEITAADQKGRNWLTVLTVATAATILIVSGLIFWQRSQRAGLGVSALHRGQQLVSEGALDEGIAALRTSLAQDPKNLETRAALGLTLERAGRIDESLAYLTPVAEAEPHNGPVWLALGEAAAAQGDKSRALLLYRKALAGEWPPAEDSRRRRAQLDFARLTAETGRRREAIAMLLGVIQQRGDDPVIAREAADFIGKIGSAQELEEAYEGLTEHFPADPALWTRLAEVRAGLKEDAPALDAYRRALAIDPESTAAKEGASAVEGTLELNPSAPGLTSRERTRRIDSIVARVSAVAAGCAHSVNGISLKATGHPAGGAERRLEAAESVWRALDSACKNDATLARVMDRVSRQ